MAKEGSWNLLGDYSKLPISAHNSGKCDLPNNNLAQSGRSLEPKSLKVKPNHLY